MARKYYTPGELPGHVGKPTCLAVTRTAKYNRPGVTVESFAKPMFNYWLSAPKEPPSRSGDPITAFRSPIGAQQFQLLTSQPYGRQACATTSGPSAVR